MGDYDAAKPFYESASCYGRLAVLAYRAGDVARAQIIATSQTDPSSLWVLASLAEQAGDLEKAKAGFDGAAKAVDALVRSGPCLPHKLMEARAIAAAHAAL